MAKSIRWIIAITLGWEPEQKAEFTQHLLQISNAWPANEPFSGFTYIADPDIQQSNIPKSSKLLATCFSFPSLEGEEQLFEFIQNFIEKCITEETEVNYTPYNLPESGDCYLVFISTENATSSDNRRMVQQIRRTIKDGQKAKALSPIQRKKNEPTADTKPKFFNPTQEVAKPLPKIQEFEPTPNPFPPLEESDNTSDLRKTAIKPLSEIPSVNSTKFLDAETKSPIPPNEIPSETANDNNEEWASFVKDLNHEIKATSEPEVKKPITKRNPLANIPKAPAIPQMYMNLPSESSNMDYSEWQDFLTGLETGTPPSPPTPNEPNQNTETNLSSSGYPKPPSTYQQQTEIPASSMPISDEGTKTDSKLFQGRGLILTNKELALERALQRQSQKEDTSPESVDPNMPPTSQIAKQYSKTRRLRSVPSQIFGQAGQFAGTQPGNFINPSPPNPLIKPVNISNSPMTPPNPLVKPINIATSPMTPPNSLINQVNISASPMTPPNSLMNQLMTPPNSLMNQPNIVASPMTPPNSLMNQANIVASPMTPPNSLMNQPNIVASPMTPPNSLMNQANIVASPMTPPNSLINQSNIVASPMSPYPQIKLSAPFPKPISLSTDNRIQQAKSSVEMETQPLTPPPEAEVKIIKIANDPLKYSALSKVSNIERKHESEKAAGKSKKKFGKILRDIITFLFLLCIISSAILYIWYINGGDTILNPYLQKLQNLYVVWQKPSNELDKNFQLLLQNIEQHPDNFIENIKLLNDFISVAKTEQQNILVETAQKKYQEIILLIKKSWKVEIQKLSEEEKLKHIKNLQEKYSKIPEINLNNYILGFIQQDVLLNTKVNDYQKSLATIKNYRSFSELKNLENFLNMLEKDIQAEEQFFGQVLKGIAAYQKAKVAVQLDINNGKNVEQLKIKAVIIGYSKTDITIFFNKKQSKHLLSELTGDTLRRFQSVCKPSSSVEERSYQTGLYFFSQQNFIFAEEEFTKANRIEDYKQKLKYYQTFLE